jgi:hypothetical protein
MEYRKHLRFKYRRISDWDLDPGSLVFIHEPAKVKLSINSKIPPSDLRPPSKRNHRRESDIHMKNMTKL